MTIDEIFLLYRNRVTHIMSEAELFLGDFMEILIQNVSYITWQMLVMWVIGGLLIYLAIEKDMEPTLLLPMGFGAILVNLPVAVPDSGVQHVLGTLFSIGIEGAELFPLMLFIGIGAMIDFQPLLTNPKLMIFGAAAQFGIFFTLALASLLGYDLRDAASMDAVVDAVVAGLVAAGHAGVSGVNNGTAGQSCNIAPPEIETLPHRGQVSQPGDLLFRQLLPEVFILHPQKFRADITGAADIHQGAQKHLLAV